MNILAVDNEGDALDMLVEAIKEVVPNENTCGFSSPLAALQYARNHRVDVAFLDIDMPEMSGLFAAKELKDIYGKTNIVFVTGYKQYASSAFEIRASGYVNKPIAAKRVLEELNHLRNPVQPPHAQVHLQCFGSFVVLANGTPLLFPRAKSKELLAYLVHKRGAAATPAELASILWEDKDYNTSLQSQIRTMISEMMKVLKAAGVEDIIQRSRKNISLDVNKISCDYYGFLDGDIAAINSYMGEYMKDYSWAEFAIGYLNEQIKK